MKETDENTFGNLTVKAPNRKVRSFYKWLSRVAGIEACWIEGSDEHNRPLWGFIKRLTKHKLVVFSRRAALASLLLTPLVLSQQVTAQTSIELSDFNGIDGISFIGESASDYVGSSIAMGDINGDGFDDLIIGARGASANGNDGAGKVYVVFGSSSGFSSSNQLSSLNGTTGFTLNGISTNDLTGRALAIGDINGDGVNDIIIGVQDADVTGINNAGKTYVVFGQTSAFASSIDLSSLDGNTGFILNGIDAGDISGSVVVSGDINGDGVDDILIGAKLADQNGNSNVGETYVVFGQTTAFASSIDLSSLDGSSGFTLNGIDASDQSGSSVGSGDVNGDGIGDVIIGALAADPNGSASGESYIVFGQTDAFVSSFELSSLDGSNGFTLKGINGGDQAGLSIGSGDVNGDGIGDVIIGAPYADPNGSNSGESYVVFGQTDAFTSSFELSSLDGSNGFTLNGINGGDIAGKSIGSGDVNGDGIGDVIIGAPGSYGTSGGYYYGEVYVVFGDSATVASSVDLSSLDGDTGFAINGDTYYGYTSYSVASGDLNGDGFDDLVFSTIGASNYQGEASVFFNAIPQAITGDEGFRTLAAPSNGTVFDELLGGFWTQGFTGSDEPDTTDNVWTWDQATQNWTALTDQGTNSLTAGEGFLFYIFSDDDPLSSGDAGFPKYIAANQFGGDGSVNSGSVNPVSDLADSDFFFAGNPYFYPIDWDLLTKSGLSNTVYVYDDANSTWQSWNGSVGNITDGEIAAFQGFFIEGSGGSGSLTIEEADISSNSVSLLKQNSIEPKALKIHAEAGELSADAWLSFQEGGEIGRDAFDGLSLAPLSSSYLKLATIIGNEDQLQINALPVEFEGELRFPFDLSGLTDSSEAIISFEGLEKFEGWTLSIEDLETEEVYELADNDTLTLAIRSAQAKAVTGPASLVNPKAKADTHRFEIFLKSAVGVATEPSESELPGHVQLEQNYPNPFNPVTTIKYMMPDQGRVRLEVFDMMGRKVATLVDNELQASGSYSVQFNAASLASGMYLYQLRAGGSTLIRKLTLIK